MKLLFAIIQNDDKRPLTRALIDSDISVTRITSSGGFLHGGNTTLMIGVSEEKLSDALAIIKEYSSRRQVVTVPAAGIPHNVDSVAMPLTVTVGGATVFIVDVENYVKF
ncbi:MAG: cyclic-di-AMP receptor [Clostridia bacterium]